MAQTRLSDLSCLADVAQQQVAFPSADQSNVERVLPALNTMQRNFNMAEQGVFGYSGTLFQQWWTFPESYISMEIVSGSGGI